MCISRAQLGCTSHTSVISCERAAAMLLAAWHNARRKAAAMPLPGVGSLPRPTLYRTQRSISIWERIKAMNEKLRKSSEAAHEQRRAVLRSDFSNHSQHMKSIGQIIHKRNTDVHPPPEALYDHKSAFNFPDLQTISLEGGKVHLSAEKHFKDKVTLVSCVGSRFSQRMVDAWLNGILSEEIHETDRPSQVVWLNFVEGPLFKIGIFRRMLLRSAKSQFPTENQPCVLFHFGSSLHVRQKLNMTNLYLGYVCAVDGQGIVRWHVHAMDPPEQEQLAALGKLVREMHNKQKQKQRKISIQTASP